MNNEDATEEDDENEESSSKFTHFGAHDIYENVNRYWHYLAVGCEYFYPRPFVGNLIVVECTSTLHSSEYAEEMTASTFLGESKPLFATSISSVAAKSHFRCHLRVRSNDAASVSKQYECQRNSFLLPVCRNVSACSEKFGCTSENNIKSTIDYEMMKQAEFTYTIDGSRKSPFPCAFYYLDATTNTMTIAASPTAYHAIPTALSLIDESMFASAFREKGLTLTAINSPLPLSKSNRRLGRASQRSLYSMFVAMCAVRIEHSIGYTHTVARS